MIFVEEKDDRYYVGKSTIPNAGLGCFAKIFLKKNDWLEVIGVYVKTGSPADLCTEYARRYKFAGSEKLDAKIVPMGFASIVNHSDDSKLQNCRLTFDKKLMKRSEHAGQVVYMFTRDILPGEELIGNYGTDVGQEINQIANDLAFGEDNRTEIDKFLPYNFYNLAVIVGKLREI
jgi:hypothetical protein